jgi:hypothetical protein
MTAMPELEYRGRRAHRVENDLVRVIVTVEGGHIASIEHKPSGVNPLWSPPWPTIEPSTYTRQRHPEYGSDAESKLLSGILGHNLCLDLFGPPSSEEAAAGITVHGEASIAQYHIESGDLELTAACEMPAAQIGFQRRIRLRPGDSTVFIDETVENKSALDRPIAWTQHVTLGPPFLAKGKTQFRAPATRSRNITGEDFNWPYLPQADGRRQDLQVFTEASSSGGFTTHLMDPHRDEAYFMAWSPDSKVLFGYRWRRADFPWLGIWEENYSRKSPPWNGKALTRGMEFGASPIPESRRQMIDRRELFGTPAYRWLPAKARLHVDYTAFIRSADSIPESIT